jgi:hypothetical protein
MLRPIVKITFTKEDGSTYIFDFVNSVEIKSSYENFTDTAKIILPRKLSFQGKNLFTGSTAIFRRSDEVKIELGYFPNLEVIFEGYISNVNASLPVEIECEDKMFILKNTKCTYPKKVGYITLGKKGKPLKKPKVVSEAITLDDLLGNILPDDIEYKCLDVNIGSFRASNASVVQILDALKKDYGFYSYFVNGILHVGLASDASDTITEEFYFEKTIINPDELKYQIKDELFVKVVAISMQSDNSKKEITVGDEDGSQRTYYTYNATDAALKEFADLKLNEVKYTGYSGTFETFGEPKVRHGDIAKLTSAKLPERDGNYDIVSVVTKLDMGGFRQEIELGTIV